MLCVLTSKCMSSHGCSELCVILADYTQVVKNLVPKIATTKGLSNQFPFVYTVAKYGLLTTMGMKQNAYFRKKMSIFDVFHHEHLVKPAD